MALAQALVFVYSGPASLFPPAHGESPRGKCFHNSGSRRAGESQTFERSSCSRNCVLRDHPDEGLFFLWLKQSRTRKSGPWKVCFTGRTPQVHDCISRVGEQGAAGFALVNPRPAVNALGSHHVAFTSLKEVMARIWPWKLRLPSRLRPRTFSQSALVNVPPQRLRCNGLIPERTSTCSFRFCMFPHRLDTEQVCLDHVDLLVPSCGKKEQCRAGRDTEHVPVRHHRPREHQR